MPCATSCSASTDRRPSRARCTRGTRRLRLPAGGDRRRRRVGARDLRDRREAPRDGLGCARSPPGSLGTGGPRLRPQGLGSADRLRERPQQQKDGHGRRGDAPAPVAPAAAFGGRGRTDLPDRTDERVAAALREAARSGRGAARSRARRGRRPQRLQDGPRAPRGRGGRRRLRRERRRGPRAHSPRGLRFSWSSTGDFRA